MQRKYNIKDKETIYKYNNDIIHNRMATISYSMQLILYNEKKKKLINDIELKSLKANQMLPKEKFNIYINEQRIRKKIRLYKWKKKIPKDLSASQ
jgi:hypothetical protein